MKNFYPILDELPIPVNTSNKEQNLDSRERLKRKVLIQENLENQFIKVAFH